MGEATFCLLRPLIKANNPPIHLRPLPVVTAFIIQVGREMVFHFEKQSITTQTFVAPTMLWEKEVAISPSVTQ